MSNSTSNRSLYDSIGCFPILITSKQTGNYTEMAIREAVSWPESGSGKFPGFD